MKLAIFIKSDMKMMMILSIKILLCINIITSDRIILQPRFIQTPERIDLEEEKYVSITFTIWIYLLHFHLIIATIIYSFLN